MIQKLNFQKLECSQKQTRTECGLRSVQKSSSSGMKLRKYVLRILSILYFSNFVFSNSVYAQEKKEVKTTVPQTKENGSEKNLDPSQKSSTNIQTRPEPKVFNETESKNDSEEFQSKEDLEKKEQPRDDSSSKGTQEENKHLPKFGFFIDSYYAHNPYRPHSRDNRYLTQPARWDEANINLAYIDGKVETDQYRGRVAFQFGNSVNANYKYEVSSEKNSNELSVRNIQEAYAGVKLAKNLWLDGGIYFGNIGLESWISQNNWNYSRALSLDYVPYYSSGFRLSYQYSEKLSFQLHLMNGWSNITETNRDKAIGTQIDYKITDKFKITHNTFVGNEAPDNRPRQTRYYNNLILQYHITKHFIVAGSGDVGIQRVPDPGVQAYRQWYHGTFWITWRPIEKFRTSLRLERMYDSQQTIVQTDTKNGFLTSGATTTFDYIPNENAMIRLEGRYFRSYDAVFDRDRSKSKEEKFIVFAISLKI
ncbi:outer membrane protein [Leptospira weilii serovar Ranarum str. ICFT]|uniref:Outer membrane protein n=1 Tax=Leptospira weilii serovar Ranarum str. ICFT TaxID=1218598 RepID=N1WQB8_9LEPT|nr:porin [Leptospira weilii]EMY79334.1 outer membrane protein [Leptospira weilii serovar Ranarum str. ICFT]